MANINIKDFSLFFILMIIFAKSSTSFENIYFILFINLILFVYSLTKQKPKFIFYIIIILFILQFLMLNEIFNRFYLQFLINNICYILFSYSILNIFQNRFFSYYENFITIISVISLPLFFIQIISINFINNINVTIQKFFNIKIDELYASSCEYYSTSLIYTVNQSGTDFSSFRNSGFTFEPGMFACFILIGIVFNLLINNFKNNRNLIFLVLALITTQSTTGLIGLLIVFVFYMINNDNFKRKILFNICILSIICFGIIFSDIGITKIQNTIDLDFNLEYSIEESQSDKDRVVSLGRIGGIKYALFNELPISPILGLGNYGYENQNLATASGIGLFLRTFGLLGIFLYLYALLKSCKYIIHNKFNKKGYILVFTLIIVMHFSFGIHSYPFFWTIFLYYYFYNKVI